jgi:hypothetical protein
MPLTLQEARALVSRLGNELEARRPNMKEWHDYFEGRHNLSFASERFQRAFGGMFSTFADNWCAPVCEIPAQRLEVRGFRFGDQTQDDRDARNIWQRNAMDAESKVLTLEKHVKSRAFVMVWADDPSEPDPEPLITVEDPTQTIVVYEPESRRRRKAALKMWAGDDGWDYATLYLADELWKMKRRARVDSAAARIIVPDGVESPYDWVPRFDDSTMTVIPNPLGQVPIVEFANRRRLKAAPTPEHKPVMPLQNAVNKLLADMMVAAEAGAFPARWGTGVDLPRDPLTGQEIDDPDMWRLSLSKMLRATDPAAKFGNFDAADLSNFTKGIELLVQHIAALTQTPPYYLLGQVANLSGDALAAAEAGLVAKCRDKTVFDGEDWEEVMRLAFAVKGDAKAHEYNAEAIWRDVEFRSESQLADALLKKKQVGVPFRQLMEDAGYSQTAIDRMEVFAEQDAERAARALSLGLPDMSLTEPNLAPAPVVASAEA